jgi:adhesin/invasin
VTDSAGAPLSDIPVSLGVLDRGSVSAQAERTDSLGQLSAKWVMGPRSGIQRLRVEVGNPRTLAPFTVSGTALPGPPATIAIRTSPIQGVVGRPLAQPVIVTALDAAGNPVLDARVTVRALRGSIADPAPPVDTQGRALVRWTLGDTAGAQVLEVRVAGIDSVARVTAHATAGPAAAIVLKEEAGKAGAPVTLTATVTDSHGNLVAKAPVGFAATSGKVSVAKALTDDAGRATTRWTPGTKPAAQTLTARLTGTKISATFSRPAPTVVAAPAAKRRQK